MPFADSGSASQAEGDYHQILSNLAQIAGLFLQNFSLPERKASEEQERESPEDQVFQLPDEVQQLPGQDLKQLCEDGSVRLTHQISGSTPPMLSGGADQIFPTSKDFSVSLQTSPNRPDLYIFFEPYAPLSLAEQELMLDRFGDAIAEIETAYPSYQVQGFLLPEPPQGIDRVKQQLDRMGDSAPAGSKAIVVADQILGNQTTVTGGNFGAVRLQDGSISVIDSRTQETIAQMDASGNISQSMTPGQQGQFAQMYAKLQSAQQKAQIPQVAVAGVAKPLKSASVEIGGR